MVVVVVGGEVFGLTGTDVEVAVVVTADDYLLGMRERFEPVDGFLDLFDCPVVAEISGVD